MKEPVKRCSLETARIAGGCKMPENHAAAILIHLNKAIGHYLLQENRKVMLDFDIQRGMVLFFEGDRVRFMEKSEALKDQVLAVLDDSTASAGGQRSRRVTHANILHSVGGRRNSDERLPTDEDQHDETRSMRSQPRSLNIALSSIGKRRRG